MNTTIMCSPVSLLHLKIDRHFHKTDIDPCLECSSLQENMGIPALLLSAVQEGISRLLDSNSICTLAQLLQGPLLKTLVHKTMDTIQYFLPRVRHLMKSVALTDVTRSSDTVNSEDKSSFNKNLASLYDEVSTVFTLLQKATESRIKHSIDLMNRPTWEIEISDLLLKTLVNSKVFAFFCHRSSCILQKALHEVLREETVEAQVPLTHASYRIQFQQSEMKDQMFVFKEFFDIAAYKTFGGGMRFLDVQLNQEMYASRGVEMLAAHLKAKLVESDGEVQIRDFLLTLGFIAPAPLQGEIGVQFFVYKEHLMDYHVNKSTRLDIAPYYFEDIISEGQTLCIPLLSDTDSYGATHPGEKLIAHVIPTQGCELQSTGTTASNEEPDSLQDGIKTPQKNHLNSDLPAHDAALANSQTGLGVPGLLRMKDHHPLGVGSNPPTVYPEKLEDTCYGDIPCVPKKCSTVLNPKEDGISVEHPSTPHDHLSGKLAEPSPRSEQTPPGDSSLQLGIKRLDNSLHDATEIDRSVSTESNTHPRRGIEHLQVEDVIGKADEDYYYSPEPKEIYPEESLQPVTTETMDDSAIEEEGTAYPEEGDGAEEDLSTLSVLKVGIGESLQPVTTETMDDGAIEEEGTTYPEEGDRAEEDLSTLLALKVGIPQTHPSQGSQEGRSHLDAVSLRDRYGKPFGENEPQRNPRGIVVENTGVETSPALTTENEEFAALEPVEHSTEEARCVSELKGEALTENPSGDRRQTGENHAPELSQQSHTEETTSGVRFLFIKEGITMTIRLSSQSELVDEPELQEPAEGDKYSIAELETLLGELARSHTTTNAHLPDPDPYPGSTVADEDYVNLAEIRGTFHPQRSLTETGRRSSLRMNLDPFQSVNPHKVSDSQRDLSNTRSENDRHLNQNSSDGRSFNCERQSAAESRTMSTAETYCLEKKLVDGDPSRETSCVRLPYPAKTGLSLFHQRLSQFELLLRSIMLRPLFPNLRNGLLRVDFRSPTREPMNIEGFRLCTFLHCPNTEALPALRLANAGFYYTGRDGVVACYSCDLRCRHDEARLQGDPYAFHRERNRHCPHMNNMDQNNLFIQDHQTCAHSGRDITGSPSEGTRGEQESVREMAATSRQEMGHALTEFQGRIGALSIVSTETSATGRAPLHGAGSEHEPQSSAADVSPHEATSASAGNEGGSPRGPHSVSSLHSSSEGAENAPAASTTTTTNTANNTTARQDSPASQHPAGVAAITRTTSSQTASSAASHQVSNTSLLNSGRGQLATGGRDTGNSNRSASYETIERSSGDITSSSGDATRENPRTGRSPQEDLESRQTPSQRDYAPTRGNDEPSGGNDSRTFRPRMGLLGGSSAHGELREIPVYSAVNESPSAVNNTTQGGEAPPAPRQVEAVAPSDTVRPAPPLPAYDPSRAVHRQYAAIETRERSFLGRWPDTHAQSPEELAQAGFFYAGAEDCVRCHFCGLGLKHWDPDDRPLEEHMRWRSSCGFLRVLMGEDEIARTLARIGRRPNGSAGQPAAGIASARSPRGSVPNGNAPQMTSPGLRAEAERFMTSEVVIAAREMGFPDDSIRRGIEALLRTSAGRRAVTSQNLVHAILFLRERGRDLDSPTPNNAYVVDVSSDESDDETAPLPPNDSQRNRRANALENVSGSGLVGHAVFPPNRDGMVYYAHTEQSGSDGNVGQQARSHRSSPNSSSPSQSRQTPAHADASMNGQDGAQTIRQLEQENQELRERRRCKICLDNDISILFLPCGHLVCCAECAPALRRCPMCRRRVSGTVSIQFAGVPSGQLQ